MERTRQILELVLYSKQPHAATFFVRPQFLSDLPQIWNVGHKSDNEDQIRWPMKPEVVNAHGRQFTSS